MNVFLIAAGGFGGALSRYWISLLFNKQEPLKPYGTWFANTSGSFLLGFIFAGWMNELLPDWVWYLGGVGFCGSFTTFSTFGNETFLMIRQGQLGKVFVYVISSLLASLFAVSVSIVFFL